MRTIGQDTAGKPCTVHNRPDQAGIPLRDGQGKEDGGTKRCRYPFLTMPVARMAPSSVLKEWEPGEWHELISPENNEFLRDSYLRYAELLGKSVTLPQGKTLGENISKLYMAMDDLVGDDIGVNIEQDEGRLKFRLWKCHRWGESTLYYFPVKFMETLNPELQRISATFMHDLMSGNGMNTVLECDEFDYAMGCFTEPCYDGPSEESKKRIRLCRSYEKGKIRRLLKHIGSKRYYKDLVCALDRYVPRDIYEKGLTDLMREGLQFLYPEKPLMGYAYDPYFREKPEFSPIGLESQVMVVYDNQDSFMEYITDYYNAYYPETYEIVPMEVLDLSPDTDRLFTMDDDYPTRFFMWADRYIDYISYHENDEPAYKGNH